MYCHLRHKAEVLIFPLAYCFSLQKPPHLPCQSFFTMVLSLIQKQHQSYNFLLIPCITIHKLATSPLHSCRQISYLPATTRRLLQRSFFFFWLVSTVLRRAERLHSLVERTIHLKKNYHSTTCHFSYDPLQNLSLPFCAMKYLPRLSPPVCH